MRTKKEKGNITSLQYQPVGMAEGISATLTKAILEGVLESGQQLVEATLQKQFGVSKSPVREALRDLEKKGLAVLVPRKGTFVKALTVEEIEENYEIRSLLEPFAARKGYERMTEENLEKMKQAFSSMKQAAADGNALEYWNHHQAFHDSYLEIPGSQLLREILSKLRMHNAWYRNQFLSTDLKRDLQTHSLLLKYYTNHRVVPSTIEKEMKAHVRVGLANFEKYLSRIEKTKKNG
jgi:DNA-binding GntR family transcriptional regulator